MPREDENNTASLAARAAAKKALKARFDVAAKGLNKKATHLSSREVDKFHSGEAARQAAAAKAAAATRTRGDAANRRSVQANRSKKATSRGLLNNTSRAAMRQVNPGRARGAPSASKLGFRTTLGVS